MVSMGGKTFFCDANFSARLCGIRRQTPVGIDLSALPAADGLLVTHAHYDHLDIPSYKYFSLKTPILVPRRLTKLIHRYVTNPVTELAAWEEYVCGSVTITAVPAKHHGFRLFPGHHAGAIGYVISDGRWSVYLAGDTAYGEHFAAIGRRFRLDVACLPIGAYKPRWFMKSRHLNPGEALQALQDLGAKTMLPIHWGSFRLGLDGVDEPIKVLATELTHRPEFAERVKILKEGEFLDMSPPAC